jgi:hypothetical protein
MDTASKSRTPRIGTLAMAAALIGLGLAGLHYSPLLLPKVDVTAAADAACDLQQRACGARLPGGEHIELSITPRPIPFLQPLQVEVGIRGMEARKVEIDFAGASMNMGYKRTPLIATGAGRHRGQTSLPVCVSGRMTWVATVLIETDRQRIAVPFRFDVGR